MHAVGTNSGSKIVLYETFDEPSNVVDKPSKVEN